MKKPGHEIGTRLRTGAHYILCGEIYTYCGAGVHKDTKEIVCISKRYDEVYISNRDKFYHLLNSLGANHLQSSKRPANINLLDPCIVDPIEHKQFQYKGGEVFEVLAIGYLCWSLAPPTPEKWVIIKMIKRGLVYVFPLAQWSQYFVLKEQAIDEKRIH